MAEPRIVENYAGLPYRLAGCFDCGKAASVRAEFKAGPSFSAFSVYYPPGWLLAVSPHPEGEHLETLCPNCVSRRKAGGGSEP